MTQKNQQSNETLPSIPQQTFKIALDLSALKMGSETEHVDKKHIAASVEDLLLELTKAINHVQKNKPSSSSSC